MLDLDYKVLKVLYRTPILLKVGEISKLLNIPHSTIGTCIKRLEKKKYVLYKRYQPVMLTKSGENLSIELIRHAKLMEKLLVEELELTVEEAHAESEKFNLLFSCSTINKICEKYNHPAKSPCGEFILNSNDCYCDKSEKKI